MDLQTYAYTLVNRLCFTRYGGTEGERKAETIIRQEIEKSGGNSEVMPFSIPSFTIMQSTLAVTSPYTRVIEAVPYGRSGSIDAALSLVYLEDSSEQSFAGREDLSGTVALINTLDLDMYRALIDHKCDAFILIASDKWFNDKDDFALKPQILRAKFAKLGKVPGFMIRSRDAAELLRSGAQKLRLRLTQNETEAASANVLSVIPGTTCPKKSLILTAHYDSVNTGVGAWDNATGAATLLFLYRYFLQHPTKHTLRFLWCGSEEQGLLGSQAFVGTHSELLPEIQMVVNFDMCGTILGQNELFIAGNDALKNFCRQFCLEQGYPCKYYEHVQSSDSAPFQRVGIPAVGLSRGTRAAEFHTTHDLPDIISPEALYRNGSFAVAFIERLANATVIPIRRELSPEVQAEVENYFAIR